MALARVVGSLLLVGLVASPAQAKSWWQELLPQGAASPTPSPAVQAEAPASPPQASPEAVATAAAAPASAPPRPGPVGMAYVWRVWAPGASQADLLVGTMHVPLPPGASFPPPLAEALAKATWVATEIDPDGVSPELVRRYVAQPPGGRLSRQLGPRRWRALLASGKVDAAAAEHLRPWAVALSFLPPPRRPSMDESLRMAGAKAGARLGHLESPAEQLGALAGVPDREMIHQLEELAADPSRGAREQNALEAAYRRGDLVTIRRMLLDPARMRRYPGFYRKLFAERNARMVARLVGPLAREEGVVAVGLGHLIGPGSVLQGLQAKGWRVSQAWPLPAANASPRPAQRPTPRPRLRPSPRPNLRPSPVLRPAVAPSLRPDGPASGAAPGLRPPVATPSPRPVATPGLRPVAAPTRRPAASPRPAVGRRPLPRASQAPRRGPNRPLASVAPSPTPRPVVKPSAAPGGEAPAKPEGGASSVGTPKG